MIKKLSITNPGTNNYLSYKTIGSERDYHQRYNRGYSFIAIYYTCRSNIQQAGSAGDNCGENSEAHSNSLRSRRCVPQCFSWTPRATFRLRQAIAAGDNWFAMGSTVAKTYINYIFRLFSIFNPCPYVGLLTEILWISYCLNHKNKFHLVYEIL